jgi:choline-glycine betaine transporter
MGATMFHWGLHPWAIYAVVALSLAFFTYNKGLPLTIRSAFYPLIKDRVWGWFGHLIDVVAVLATIFGLATSLGFGAQQAGAGLQHSCSAYPTPSTPRSQSSSASRRSRRSRSCADSRAASSC